LYNKRVALLDVDDILLKFIEGFNKHLSTNGFEGTIHPNYLPRTWDYKELGDVSSQLRAYIDAETDDLDAFEGAAAFTEDLRELGMEVVLLTAHPAHLTLDRIRNLKKHGIYFDQLYCTAGYDNHGKKVYHSKAEFARELFDSTRKIVFADDKASTVVDMVGELENVTGVTLARPYNDDVLADLQLFDKDSDRLFVAGEASNLPEQQVNELYDKFLEKAREL